MSWNVIIVGMGALGLMFGRRMQENLGPEAVRFLMDPERKKRHAGDAYTVNGRAVRFPVVTPEELTEPADLVVFATKYGGLHEAVCLARPAVGENTTLISLLNGISSEDILAETYPAEQILDCVAIGMDAMRDGSDLSYANMGRLQIGSRDGTQTERLAALARFLEESGVPYEVCGDIRRAMWNKFMINVGINQTCMVYETTYSGALTIPEARADLSAVMHEVIAVAAAEGVGLTQSDYDADIAILSGLNPRGYPSMRQDALAGRRSEVELFAGTVIRIAERHGIDVPVNKKYYQRIREMEARLPV